MMAQMTLESAAHSYDEDALFEQIAMDLQQQGYTVLPSALPDDLTLSLYQQINAEQTQFEAAGIGRNDEHVQNETIRSDEISWIDRNTSAGNDWLTWAERLQSYMNRRLYLGLFSFESHFAHYAAGDFYKRHVDAFRGQANRILTLVTYLNPDWSVDDGGEMVLYQDEHDVEGLKVIPRMGTLVIFLSEEFPHEVLAANKDRYSIAGWFRLNSSTAQRIDPPA